MTVIFTGRKFANNKTKKLKILAGNWVKQKGRPPKVVFVLFDQNLQSELFVRIKIKVAKKIGIETETKKWAALACRPEECIKRIQKLSKDSGVDGIVVQLPLPKKLIPCQKDILKAIGLPKDIDGLRDDSFFWPAVVKATREIISHYDLLSKKEVAAVVGAKGWVGKHLVKMLKKQKAAKTPPGKILEIDLNTKNTLNDLKEVDLIISCAGQPGLIKAEFVKKGAAVLDLGMMVVEKKNGRALKGDVDFAGVCQKAGFISPVPGGIGPVTAACLFENLLTRPC
ncbi:bifunctional 5,10-methylenetetrahydrofolate dehydrogenase/5,10-methenyltetrahydrofolate cyclohydrolase [Candidatus Shapirobacteria bacterium]|nr:bifunctional 5,10-methylenetetrahydrofolate dehydrogenase/5,10-methenyltetrahydrofolate cyclohydrolase [Candidatus Shapirobacteria bacterium]